MPVTRHRDCRRRPAAATTNKTRNFRSCLDLPSPHDDCPLRPQARARKFVYFTEVKNIPSMDLRNMERLWLKYSDGKFGYSVQRKVRILVMLHLTAGATTASLCFTRPLRYQS